ncbi:hypothetical protein [Caulobacter sp.]|uniref:hypothetical protein n=1 Tax=Caulobacter sp. TaxID=78 RepID=UPI001B2378C5|nr:hypothetical protein [Caulobacter sp.]MBO9546958.1 hypothetical protein [Caulobacter sp.]
MVVESDDKTYDLMESFPAKDAPNYDGFVKFKLVHGVGYSVFLPDAVFLQDGEGWRWFEPQMFDAPLLSFYEQQSYAQFAIETSHGDELLVATTEDRFVTRFADGAQLFRCRVAGDAELLRRSAGRAHLRLDGGFDLDLFHHTTPAARDAILASCELRGSAWNIRGTRALENVAYAYLTSLPQITNSLDLQAIAMASDGVLHFLLDNRVAPDGIVTLRVYRETTANRMATVALRIPAEFVAGQHLWRHEPDNRGVFYESSHTAIYRVGLAPGATLRFSEGRVGLETPGLKRFGYAIVGDARSPSGIAAPFEEETTSGIVKVEFCNDLDLLTFWRTRANEDHFSGRSAELQVLRGASGDFREQR